MDESESYSSQASGFSAAWNKNNLIVKEKKEKKRKLNLPQKGNGWQKTPLHK